MERTEKSIEIGVPVHAAYNQWTQFEDFPRFMDGVKEVRQLDDTHLHWRASVGGKEKEWDAVITEQVPDRVIAWRSTSGAPNMGEVRFERISPDRTRVRLALEYEPQTIVEKVGDALGVMSHHVSKTVEEFKDFIERRGDSTGAWRGEVEGGQVERGAGTGRDTPPSGLGTANEAPGTRGGASGLGGRGAAGNPAGHGIAADAAGGAYPGNTGGTPAPGGGKPGNPPGGAPGSRR